MRVQPSPEAKKWFHNVWIHDLADRFKIRRHLLAKDAGLDEDAVQPYPMSKGDTTVINNKRGLGPLGVLSAMGIGAAITAGGMKYISPPIPTVPPIEPREVEIEVWSDGEKFEFRPKRDQ